MSNRTKGEIGFDAGGKRYTLCFSVNALCALEDRLEIGAVTVAQQMADASTMRIGTARALFWAGLQDAHPELTLDAAGAVMSEIGITAAVEVISKGMAAAFPDEAGGPLGARQNKAAGKRS